MEGLTEIDQTLFLYLNGLGTPMWDELWMFLSSDIFTVITVVFLSIWSYKLFGWKGLVYLMLIAIIVIMITDQTTNLFKNVLVKRPRPCYQEFIISKMRLVKSHCGGRYGYFSAHAANYFAIASLFAQIFKNKFLWILLLLSASLVAYSRIYIGVHYPLDILSGAVFGALVGWGGYKLSIKLNNKWIYERR